MSLTLKKPKKKGGGGAKKKKATALPKVVEENDDEDDDDEVSLRKLFSQLVVSTKQVYRVLLPLQKRPNVLRHHQSQPILRSTQMTQISQPHSRGTTPC